MSAPDVETIDRPARPKGDPAKFAEVIAAEFRDASAGMKATILNLVAETGAQISGDQCSPAYFAGVLSKQLAGQRKVGDVSEILRKYGVIATAGNGLPVTQVGLILSGVAVGLR